MSDPNLSISNQALQFIRQEVHQASAKVVESEGSLSQYVENTLFLQQKEKFKDLEKLKNAQNKEALENPEEIRIEGVETSDEVASRFQKNNSELSAKTLTILQSLISEKDTPEEIVAKTLSIYPDPALADEAMDFLLATCSQEMLDTLKKAKGLLNRDYEKQIKSGRNIGSAAREFSKEGLGSPTSLRDMYRDVTGNKREPLKLFDELAEKFPYPKLKSVITFLLHSLGADLKSKGPSIDRGELVRLIEETRSLQGILGIFRFFQSRSKLVQRQIDSYSLKAPSYLNFETLSKLLVKMLLEKYINAEKILQTATLLGIKDFTTAQIIIFSQMYDALRQISPRYYRTPQHRNELAKAFIDTLEQLEDKLEEELAEEKKQKKKK